MATKSATLDGNEVQIDREALEQFRLTFRGPVLTRDDAGRDAVRPPYNAMYPGNPQLVVRPTGTADVIDAIKFARAQKLVVAVRGGGHSVAGLSSVEGGMLVDLALMNGVDVDPGARVARIQGGAIWGEVDRETQAFGLVVPGGVVSDTGVAGLTLGGGEGWVRRTYGLSCDSLLSAQIVCADGEARTASADVNPDLFWAIRGGGGNFGIATQFTFRCHPLGPIVAFAGVFYPVADAKNVIRGFREYMRGAPDEVTAVTVTFTMPADEHLPPEVHNKVCTIVGGLYVGDAEKGMKVLQPLRELGTPLADISQPMPFTVVNSAFDPIFPRARLRSYWKSQYLTELSDPTIEYLAKKAQSRPAPLTLVVTFAMGGAINRVGSTDTAYAERSAPWMISFDGNWPDAADDAKVVGWVREAWSDLSKFGTGRPYLNFTGIADEGADVGVESAHGPNLKRLAEIKKKYDPTNFFRINNNIKPAG